MNSYFVGAPTLNRPVSQVCTAAQFAEDDFLRLVATFKQTPRMHRKQWEYAYTLRVLEVHDMLRAGRNGVGFGVSDEPILAVMAAAGMQLTATEHPAYRPGGQVREQLSVMDVFYGGICAEDEFRRRVAFCTVDMNAMPLGLGVFDVVWACSVIEELGSIRAGADFVVAASGLLKRGGIGVFTTQFNARSDSSTIESPRLSVWRRLDLLDLLDRLVEAGCEMLPLSLTPGNLPEDAIVDTPPYANPVHLKLTSGDHTLTSVGFAFRKP